MPQNVTILDRKLLEEVGVSVQWEEFALLGFSKGALEEELCLDKT